MLTGNIGAQRVSVGNYIDPTKSMSTALGTLHSNAIAEKARRDKLAQEAIANEQANRRIQIAEADEARKVDVYNRALADQKAITSSMQNNLVNPDLLKGTEKVYQDIDAQYGPDTFDANGVLANKDKQAAYDRANAALMPNDKLTKEYATPLNTADYQQRVLNDMGEASPAARAAAISLIKAQYPQQDLTAYNKALTANYKTAADARNKLTVGAGIDTRVTGGGKTSSSSTSDGSISGKSYADVTDSLIMSGGLGDNWNPNSTDASQLREMSTLVQQAGGKIKLKDGSTITVSRREWSDAIKTAKDAKDSNVIFNEGLNSEKFQEHLKRAAGTNPDKGGKYGSGTGGPKVTTKTVNASALAQIQRNLAADVMNTKQQFGMTGKGNETSSEILTRLFGDVLTKEDKKVKDKKNGKKPPKATPPKKGTYASTPLLQKAMSGPKGDNAVMNLALTDPDNFVKEYNSKSLTKAARNNIDNILYTSKVPEGFKGYEGESVKPTPVNVKITKLQEELNTIEPTIITTGRFGHKVEKVNPAYATVEKQIQDNKRTAAEAARPKAIKADNRALRKVTDTELREYSRQQIEAILGQSGISTENTRKFGQALMVAR